MSTPESPRPTGGASPAAKSARAKPQHPPRAADARIQQIVQSQQRLHRQRLPAAQRAGSIVLGLIGLIVLGALVLWLPISGARRPLTVDQALFTSASAVTGTGLSTITPGTDLSVFGQVVLMVLMQFGGLGFMLTAITVFRLLGRRVTLAERLTLRDSLGLTTARGLLRLTTYVLVGVMIIEAIGALLLWLNWSGRYGADEAAYLAVFHSVAAFTNAGFDIFAGSQLAQDGPPTDAYTIITISGLIFLGSIGLPVVSDLLTWWRHRRLSLHTRVTLVTAGTLVLVGTFAFFLGELIPETAFNTLPPGQLLLNSFYMSVAARSAGLVLFPHYIDLSQANVAVMVALMFIGASPAGMGGGITTSAFAVQLIGMWNYARGRDELRLRRRTIPMEFLRKSAIIIIASALINFIVVWLLLLTQRASFQSALFESVSAFGTVGFSLGLTSRLDLFGQALIIFLMFWGRLGSLTIIVALARPTVPAPIGLPEETILLG